MEPNTQLKILKLCKGMTLAQVAYRLELMEDFVANKKLKTRIRLANYAIGD